MYRHFLLYQGYAEDQTLACVLLSHEEGFKTPEEAMESFYGFLRSRAEILASDWDPCCEQVRREHPDASYCMKCGFSLERPDIVDELVVTVWENIWTGTIDSLGGKFWEAMQDVGWAFGEGIGWRFGKAAAIFRADQYFDRPDGNTLERLLWEDIRT